MNSWVFDSRPIVEWRTPNEKAFDRFRLAECQVIAKRRLGLPENRFPKDDLVAYYAYRDWNGRTSTVASISYSRSPGRTAHLAELCWTKGIPTILNFDFPPSPSAPIWKQVLSCRMIEQPDVGRLSWRPVLTWKCSRVDYFLESFFGWFREADPIFPPPLIRIEYSSRVSAHDAADTLERLMERSLPCRFKIFSLSAQANSHFDPSRWRALIAELDPSTVTPSKEPKVIDLFPERAPA